MYSQYGIVADSHWSLTMSSQRLPKRRMPMKKDKPASLIHDSLLFQAAKTMNKVVKFVKAIHQWCGPPTSYKYINPTSFFQYNHFQPRSYDVSGIVRFSIVW